MNDLVNEPNTIVDPLGSVTRDGENKIDTWMSCGIAVSRAECALLNAKNALEKAEKDLVRWLVPVDAVSGEVFAIAYGSKFIHVTVLDNAASVSLRMRRRTTNR